MSDSRPERVYQGNGVSGGVVVGTALKLDSHNRAVMKIKIRDDSSLEREMLRFQRAIEASREQLLTLKASLEEKVGAEHSFILDAHLLMLEDRTLLAEIQDSIRSHRANAEWAVRKATDRLIQAYDSLEDQYFRERSSDIENVVERILLNLSGDRPFNWESLPDDLIVVSHDFNPSSFAVMDLHKVRGLALETGGRTSHSAIIARSLRLPAVMEVRDLMPSISSGDTLLLDGDEGQLIVNPSPQRLLAARAQLEGFCRTVEPVPTSGATSTRDGTLFSLRANTELPGEGRLARRYGAEGIGLFRSEFVFFSHPQYLPTMQEQFETYKVLVQEMNPFPVAIRTLDAGGDKMLSSLAGFQPNPSMGLRGIRLSLLAKPVFAAQIEAILRAGAFGNVEIVLPMVSTIEEIREVKTVIEEVRAGIVRSGDAVTSSIPLGTMIEVPATVLTLDVLAREVDFLCVGTNDLIQYMLAVDRDNPQVAHLFHPLHPSILQCLRRISEVAHQLKKPVRVCGEISSNPFIAVLLLGMGFTQLSLNALAIPTIRKVLRAVTIDAARDLANQVMTFATVREIADCLIDQVGRMVDMDLLPYIKEIKTTAGTPSV